MASQASSSKASSSKSKPKYVAHHHWLAAPVFRWINNKCKKSRVDLDQIDRLIKSTTLNLGRRPEEEEEDEKEEDIAIYDFLAEDKRSIVYTVVVTPQPDPPIDFQELQRICRASGLICPIAQIPAVDSAQKNFRDIVALVYHPFKTMHYYLESYGTTHPSFVGFMKGVTKGLCKLQENGYCPSPITCDTIVMPDDDREGSLLLLSVRKEGQVRSNEACTKEFYILQRSIRNRLCDVKERLNADLDALLNCMELASSPAMRNRLVEAPIFASFDEKVHVLLTKLHIAMWVSPEFRRLASSCKADSKAIVRYLRGEKVPKEVKAVWDTTEKDKKVMTNAFEVCMFLRNCLHHLNKKYSDTFGTTGIAPLLRDSRLFITYIEQYFYVDLLNTLFKCTFQCNHPVFLFDYIHLPDQQGIKKVMT